ncbi:MAG: glycosyltransferase family 2 protein [Chlorobiaceae bacterium]|nr:glycosyltransferase family 2 protein [Chlorobiaceae bacterium]
MNSYGRPQVSVILATFNRAGHLDAAIDSVLDQSFEDWELIVVDDGSVDETFSVVDRHLQRHVNIRYMKHRNRHAPLARNAGIQAAFGSYITFLDSDDRYLPEHLQSRIDMLESMPEVDLLSGGFACIGDPWVRDRNDSEKLVHISECILCGTLFGRRELFTDIGGFRDIDYAEDTDLWERAAAKYQLLKIEAPESYIYQRSDDSITGTWRKSDT